MPDESPQPAKGENTASTGADVEVKYQPRDDVAKQADNPDAVQNALNAERKAAKEAAKRAEAAEAKVREYEDANASEVEKLTKRAERAEQQMKDAQASLLRFTVAAEKKVAPELVPLLTGSTKDELESQATLLTEKLQAAQKPDFDGGVRDPAPEPKTPEQEHNEFVANLLLGNAPKE